MGKKTTIFTIIGIIAIAALATFLRQDIKQIIEDLKTQPKPRETIVIGTVSQDVVGAAEEYRPIADYLAEQLAEHSIKAGRVKIASRTTEMAQWMRQGKVDLFIGSPFPAFAVDQLARSEPLVSRWKKGAEKYHAVIFAKKESGITSPDELKGKTIAFINKDSTSGYLLPKAELLNRGFTLTEVEGPSSQVNPDEIGYYFALSDNALVKAVMDNTTSAAAHNESELRILMEKDGEKIGDYIFLLTTADVYRHIVTVNRHLDPAIKEKIRSALLNLHTTPEGQEILQSAKDTTRFSDFDPPQSAYKGIEELVELVEQEIINR